MGTHFSLVAAAAATLVAGSSAAAQERAVRVSHEAIASGDLARAERVLHADRKIYGARPELLLNLAAVYAKSGRLSDATAMYRDVLGQPDAMMDLAADRAVSAHTLARLGLSRLQPTLAKR